MGGIALVLPLTFGLPPVTGLIAIGGMYYGAMYGGSTTSILVNIPGEVASVITCIDGYQMTKRGRGGAALAVVAVGSFVAGTIGLFGLVFFSPMLANAALSFGPAEFFALTVVALLVLAGISGQSLSRSLFVAALGLLITTVGTDVVTGLGRFSYDILQLSSGVELVPVAVGVFGLSELFFLVENLAATPRAHSVKLRELLPNREEWTRAIPAMIRGSGLGFLIGLLPGPVATISTFASYRMEKSASGHAEEFGKGAIEGVAGPEAANNAASSASFIPLLSLGVPFSPVLALLVAAMIVQGIQPGPLLIKEHPDIFWGLVASMYIGNVMLLVLNLPLVGVWVSLLRIPMHILISGIVLFAFVGTYSVRNNQFDLWVLLFFGLLGYYLRKLDFDMAPLILAVVLGPRIEKHLREGMMLSRGDVSVFWSSPICIVLWIFGVLALVGPPLYALAKRRMSKEPVLV